MAPEIEIPQTMRSLCIPHYMQPSGFVVSTIPIPKITKPDQVLIRVHAASINPSDLGGARGDFKLVITPKFPLRIGFDCSGTIAAVGSAVTSFQVHDRVFTCLPPLDSGAWSEYAVTSAKFVSRMPRNVSFEEAAALPMVCMTSLQAFERVRCGEEKGEEAVRGKTVLIPAGVGGVGSVACQIAKNVYGAAKVITTVSTENVSKVPKLLGAGVADRVIDYKKHDPLKEIPHGSVDILYDTAGVSPAYFPLLRRSTSSIISIHSTSSGTSLATLLPSTPTYVRLLLDAVHLARYLHAWWYGIYFEGFIQLNRGEDLKRIAAWVEEGKVKAVVGRVVELEDLMGVREACERVKSGKGGVGKIVIRVRGET